MKKILMFIIMLVLVACLNSYTYAATNVAEIGGVKYETLSGAISAAGSNNTTIVLLDSINLDGKLTFPKGSNIVLDLNGKNLTVPTVENNYGIVVGGNLTIKGTGVISLGMYGIGVQPSGNLTIENGTYKCLSGDYLLGCWGTATIKGGLFDGNYCIANGFDNGKIDILDGTFYSKESTIVLGGVTVYGGAFNHSVENYLADGVEMKLYDGVYFTGKAYKIEVEESQHGTVTVASEAVAEQPVKVTAKASKGYELDNIKVTDKNGNNGSATIEGNSYIFENSLNKVKDMLSDDKSLSCRDAIMKVFGSFDLHCELDGETIACEFDADVVMCSLLEACL